MIRLSSHLKFSLAVAGSLAVGWHTLLGASTLALRRGEYTHILLIIPISVALIYTEWPSPKAGDKTSDPVGLAVLIAGVVFALTGKFATPSGTQLTWGMLALVTWWLGAFVASYGMPTFRALLFPLCFLFWLVPIPELTLNKVVAFWQHGSALSASLLFSALGVPVTQDGVMLSIPGLNLEVAQECSSLRSSLMLIVTSMVLAHLFLRSFWRKTAVVLTAIPLSIAKNGVRIFTIAMLGTRVDRGFLDGNLHHHGGIIFFLLALFVLLVLLWLLNRRENQTFGSSSHRQNPPSAEQQLG